MNNKSLTKSYLINGPNNVVRLTDGNKIIYIIGEFHYNPGYENECPLSDEYDSIDIDKLLFKFIKTEKNKQFDLFIENFMEQLNYKPNEEPIWKYNYLNNVRKFFQSKVIMNNNKIVQNKKYPNFRFHYFDIRETLPDFYFFYEYYKNIFPYTIYDITDILNNLDIIINKLNNLQIYLLSKENKYINKILESKKVNKLFNKLVIKLIEFVINKCKKFIKLINNTKIENIQFILFTNKNINNHIIIYNEYQNIKTYIENIYIIITDLYLLTRILDKDYIKNAIVYTGACHMVDLIYILVKYFNFKVTNSFYNSKKLNIKNLNNFNYISELTKHFFVHNKNDIYTQCVNMFDFPDNFS
jgi:hypothetical protein